MSAVLGAARRIGVSALLLIAAHGAMAVAPAPVPARLSLPASAERPALTLLWSPVDAQPRPALLALHGCGGLFQRDGQTLQDRYPDYTARLHALGVHVLLVDSFGSRGLRSICAERYAERSVSVEQRRGDVIAALDWLRQRPEVDARRLALLGWSNGGTTTLAALDLRRQPALLPLAAAVIFYPGCARMQQVDIEPELPVLMQLGGADDWTPAAPCEKLVQRWQGQGRQVQLDVYPGAYHGFDSLSPLRLRADVPNGVRAEGVHQGRDEAAAQAAARRLDEFLRRHLLAPAAGAGAEAASHSPTRKSAP